MIIVIGDIILDNYLDGEYIKVSEGMPVFKKKDYKSFLGGAANVAMNIKALGEDVYLIGTIGDDKEGEFVKETLNEFKIPFTLQFVKKTNSKVRIGSFLRLDDEEYQNPDPVLFDIAHIKNLLPDSIIISDYGKGAVTQELCNDLGKTEIKILVDPKYNFYPNAYLIKPNIEEAKEMAKNQNINEAIDILKKDYPLILLTKNKDGMTLYDEDSKSDFSTEAKEIFDVCGAGDAVISTIAVCLKRGYSIGTSIRFANKAAGIVIGHRGQYNVKWKEISE